MSNKFKGIKLFAFDFDGVFTDNKVMVDGEGNETITVDRSDGHAFSLLRAAKLNDVKVVVITKEKCGATQMRCKKLSIELIEGISDKLPVLKELIEKQGITSKEVCYVGNDVNDIECMEYSGVGVAVHDSHPTVLKIADVVTKNNGGDGAVREIMDSFLETRK